MLETSSTEVSQVRRMWERLHRLPMGKHIFSRTVGLIVPYTGSIRPLVRSLDNQGCAVVMVDRRCVRNHLRSIHAIALANVAEFSTGLALAYRLPSNWRMIQTGLEMDYSKKARGNVLAVSKIEQLDERSPCSLAIVSNLTCAGQTVATGRATWRIDRMEVR